MDAFLDLQATKTALDLVEEVYRLCRTLPKEEMYGLSSQLKRASSSIVANIGEGYGRYTYADKASRYIVARGECTEVVAHLSIGVRVKYFSEQDVLHAFELAEKTGKLISGLIAYCRKKDTISVP